MEKRKKRKGIKRIKGRKKRKKIEGEKREENIVIWGREDANKGNGKQNIPFFL